MRNEPEDFEEDFLTEEEFDEWYEQYKKQEQDWVESILGE